MELLRSLQFVPGNRRNMLEKARGFQADVLVADLEDSVPPEEKSAARDLVAELVPTLSQRGQKVMVRVNSLDTGRTAEELQAVVSPQLYGVSLGKVDSPWHIRECHRLLSVEEARRGMPEGTVKIIPWIESAAGVLSASAIVCRVSPRGGPGLWGRRLYERHGFAANGEWEGGGFPAVTRALSPLAPPV